MYWTWDCLENFSVSRIKEETWKFWINMFPLYITHWEIRSHQPGWSYCLKPKEQHMTFEESNSETTDLVVLRRKTMFLHKILAGTIPLHGKFIYKHLVRGMTCSTNYDSLKASPLIWLFLIMKNNLVLSYGKYVSVCKFYFVRLPFIA